MRRVRWDRFSVARERCSRAEVPVGIKGTAEESLRAPSLPPVVLPPVVVVIAATTVVVLEVQDRHRRGVFTLVGAVELKRDPALGVVTPDFPGRSI